MVSICDLTTVKMKIPNFQSIYKAGGGAYSHDNSGCNKKWEYQDLYGNDTYGQAITTSFVFKEGDIIELQWHGP